MGLIEQAESHMAVYRRQGLFTCRADVLFDRDFFFNGDHLEAKIKQLLTLAGATNRPVKAKTTTKEADVQDTHVKERVISGLPAIVR